MFYGINPEHHTVQPINDKFRYQRKLMQDLMAPAFLHNIAAPQVYKSFTNLVTLWTEKMRLSKGHAFSVKEDVYDTALEAIWGAVFGDEDAATVTGNQIKLLSAQSHIDLPKSKDEEARFTRAPAPPAYDMVLKLTESLEPVGKSPFPKAMGVMMRYLPSQRRLLRMKDRVMAEQITKAEKRMGGIKGDVSKMTNAVDYMLRREELGAEKLGRRPEFQGRVMAAEVCTMMRPIQSSLSISPYITHKTNTPTQALRPPHSRPRHNLHNPPLGAKTPHHTPHHPTHTPHNPPHPLPRRPRTIPPPIRPRNSHMPLSLPRRMYRRDDPRGRHGGRTNAHGAR